jgi:hypothetical protein
VTEGWLVTVRPAVRPAACRTVAFGERADDPQHVRILAQVRGSRHAARQRDAVVRLGVDGLDGRVRGDRDPVGARDRTLLRAGDVDRDAGAAEHVDDRDRFDLLEAGGEGDEDAGHARDVAEASDACKPRWGAAGAPRRRAPEP